MSATFNLDGGDVPWTTTPELRLGPGAPFTDTSLQVNLFFRVALGIIAIFISFVPARLLWWNGEFAGTVFCLNIIISNFFYVLNALIWHDNNVETWWAGYGWCDLQVYIVFALQTSYNICLFEIMRGLASKVSAQQLGALTAAEKRRQHLISALIIFILPLLQVVLTYFILMRRYNVSTLAGCTAVYDPNWIFLLFFVIPSPLFIVGASTMAALAFNRVRVIHKMTSSLMHFRDDGQIARQQRVKRKLYFLSFSILLVVLPIVLFFLVANLMEGMPWTEPYDFRRIHFGPSPNNIHSITFTTSDKMGFGDLAFNYIPILSAIAVFITFGTTPDAYNEYRKGLVLVGLGKLFPKLYKEHKAPPPSTKKSWWSSFTDSFMSRDRSKEGGGSRKGSLRAIAEHVSLSNQTQTGLHWRNISPPVQQQQSRSNNNNNNLAVVKEQASSDHQNPWPDLSLEEITQHQHQHHTTRPPPQRYILPNPFRVFQLPPLPSTSGSGSASLSSILPPFRKKNKNSLQVLTHGKQPQHMRDPAMSPPLPSPHSVLSEVMYPTTIETLAAINEREEMKRFKPLQIAAGTPTFPSHHDESRVNTRAWSETNSTWDTTTTTTSCSNNESINPTRKCSMEMMPWSSPSPSPSPGTKGREEQQPPQNTTMTTGDCPVCNRLRQALGQSPSQSNDEGSSFQVMIREYIQQQRQEQQQWGVTVQTRIPHHSQ